MSVGHRPPVLRSLVMASTLAWAVLPARLASPQTAAPTPKKPIGVAIITKVAADDAPTQKAYAFLGQDNRVDQIFVARDAADFFNILQRLRDAGRSINHLTVMGHGSASAPQIEFAEGSLLPSDVDVDEITKRLSQFRAIREQRRQGNLDSAVADRSIAEYEEKLQRLASVRGVLGRNATVSLINCSTAYSDTGKNFVANLAHVLLSEGGGELLASTSDVSAGQIEDNLSWLYHSVREGRWMEEGEFYVWGRWMRFPVKPDVEGWLGTWQITSNHTYGYSKGASVTWRFSVVRERDEYAVVTPSARVKAVIANGSLRFDSVGGGNSISTTLYRVGEACSGVFDGKRVTGGQPVGGTFRGFRVSGTRNHAPATTGVRQPMLFGRGVDYAFRAFAALPPLRYGTMRNAVMTVWCVPPSPIVSSTT
jgi:hypothetical protein